MSLFWLNYRHPDGRFAGVVVIESGDLIHARLKAAFAGLDDGLEFVSGHQLDQASTKQIRREMIGRLLGDSNLHRLQ